MIYFPAKLFVPTFSGGTGLEFRLWKIILTLNLQSYTRWCRRVTTCSSLNEINANTWLLIVNLDVCDFLLSPLHGKEGLGRRFLLRDLDDKWEWRTLIAQRSTGVDPSIKNHE